MYWAWAVISLVVGMGLATLEVFIPSAGILAFLAAAAIVASVVLGFLQSVLCGLAILGVASFGVPTLLVMAFRVWPRTAIGKRVLLSVPSSDEVLPDPSQRDYLKGLVGRTAKAKCAMLPGGLVSVDGHTLEAVSEGSPVEAGQLVRIVQIRGTRLVVRLAEEDAPNAESVNPLERPIDSIGDDPFGEK